MAVAYRVRDPALKAATEQWSLKFVRDVRASTQAALVKNTPTRGTHPRSEGLATKNYTNHSKSGGRGGGLHQLIVRNDASYAEYVHGGTETFYHPRGMRIPIQDLGRAPRRASGAPRIGTPAYGDAISVKMRRGQAPNPFLAKSLAEGLRANGLRVTTQMVEGLN